MKTKLPKEPGLKPYIDYKEYLERHKLEENGETFQAYNSIIQKYKKVHDEWERKVDSIKVASIRITSEEADVLGCRYYYYDGID